MGANLGGVSKKASNNSKSSNYLKLFLLSSVYFLIIAAYTILRDLKNSVFMGVVGKEYIPWARVGALLIFIPAILFYSRLVDNIRRYHLLVAYSLFYAVFAFICAFVLGHPTIGIANTDQSPYRLFGWLFYFLIEGFSPFVLSVYWAFVNSVSSPEEAKKSYGILVGGSKIGGILSSGLVWALLSMTTVPIFGFISDVSKVQILMFASSFSLLLIPIAVKLLMSKVAGYEMHGYEAVYKVEKKRSKEGQSKTGMLAGLKMFVKYPYVLGIFAMIFFYETLATVLSYLRLHVAQESGHSVAEVSVFLFKWNFVMHSTGLIFSVLGTGAILKRFGTKISLLMIPGFMAIGSIFFFATDRATLIMIGFIITKMTHYAFSTPVREQLYIPTLKEIKFKSKSWIDAFGRTFARSTGSWMNIFANWAGASSFLSVMAVFFSAVMGLWFGVAYFLGIRFEKAIKNNEVIGLDDSDDLDD